MIIRIFVNTADFTKDCPFAIGIIWSSDSNATVYPFPYKPKCFYLFAEQVF